MRIVVDTSALIAIVRSEVEAATFVEVLGVVDEALICAATLLEAALVTAGKGDEPQRINRLIRQTNLRPVSFTLEEAEIGADAFRRYGRGSGHPAKLNFGDCFAYALARTRNLPLLFKGDDFIHTDIVPALPPA